MAANAWLVKLNLSPEAACRCGHNAHVHLHGKSCTALVDESRMRYCKCESFRSATGSANQIEQGDEMSKEKKSRAKKPKGEGRTPTLAPYAETVGGKTIYMNHNGKEHDAMVLSSGVIRMNGKDYTSPSSAGSAILGKDKKGKPRQVDGWKSWYFNKDGERVMLDTLRGSKSPLKAVDDKPKAERKAKKPRAPRKAKKQNGARSSSAASTQTAEAAA